MAGMMAGVGRPVAVQSALVAWLRKSVPLIAVLGVSKVAALLVAATIARFFDRETSGVIFFVTGVATLSVSITTLGLAAASSYYYSRNLRRARHGRNWQVFNLSLVIAVVPSILLGFFALAMEETRGSTGVLIFFVLAVSCFAFAIRQMAKMIFTIENRRDWSIIHDSITYNVVTILAIVAWGLARGSRELSLMTGLVAVLAASVIAGGLAFWHVQRKLTRDRGPFAMSSFPNRRYIGVLMAISIPSMIAQGGGLLLNKIDVVMIGPMAGPVEVGTYSVAMRVTYLAGILTEIIALFLAPKIIAMGASGDREGQWRILKLATGLQAAALAITTIPLVLFREQIITLIFGKDFIDVSSTYLILQIGKTMTALFAPVIALFTALGYNREMAKAAVVAALINVALNFGLIPRWGANGAAWATTLALVIMFVNYLWLTWTIRNAARTARRKSSGR